MIYLSHEIATLQSESQRFDAAIAQLTAAAVQQDQTAAAARARAAAARAEASRLNALAATFQSQAAADDAQAANLDKQIAAQLANEPDKFIETGDGKRKPNPEWKKWKAALDALTRQRDQARTAAAAARASATQNSAAAAQSQAAGDAADRDAAAASASAAQLRQQAAQVSRQKDALTQQITTAGRWQQEIVRTPLDRNALEQSSRELAAYVGDLESRYKEALDLAAAADKQQWYLQTLIEELSNKINSLNTQLPAAATEVANATSDLADIETQIQHLIKRQPE